MKNKHLRNLGYWAVLVSITCSIVIVITYVVMILWNLVITRIALCGEINFWQSLGLIALVSILTYDKSKLFGWLVNE